MLREGENAWEFERFGAIRSDVFTGFYVVYKDFFKILNTVVKGKWVPNELKKLKKTGFYPEINRPILSIKERYILYLKTLVFKVFTSIVPWKVQRRIVFKIKGYENKHHYSNI